MEAVVAIALLTASMSAAIAAQSTAPAPSFEVASIKPSPPPDARNFRMTGTAQPGGVWRTSNAPLVGIIRNLYPGHRLEQQVVGGPEWIRTAGCDIVARAANPNASRDEITAMARTLLTDRFKLVMRMETREMQGYALVLARADGRLGEGMKPPKFDCPPLRAARLRGEPTPPESIRGCATTIQTNAAFTALQEQLGLRLERRAIPASVLVIDSVERPTPD